MAILGMNHFTVLTADLSATLAFYGDVLGLRSGKRPPFNFPGAWMYSGETAVLHVIAGRALPADPAGLIDHMAFTANGLVGDGTWQLFCRDPGVPWSNSILTPANRRRQVLAPEDGRLVAPGTMRQASHHRTALRKTQARISLFPELDAP